MFHSFAAMDGRSPNLQTIQSMASNKSMPNATSQQTIHDSSSRHGADKTIIARTTISLEYASLVNPGHCPLGMYAVPSSDSIFIWDAVFFVHKGYYADSILKFRVTFPTNYPDSPPAVDFVTDIFHPLISSTGSFNLAPRFRPWRPKEHHVFDVLHWVKAAFKKQSLDGFQESDCFNKEAFRLFVSLNFASLLSPLNNSFRYHESAQSFAALATQSASLSQSESALYDADHPSPMGNNTGSEFVFHKLTPEQFDQERAKLGLPKWGDAYDLPSS